MERASARPVWTGAVSFGLVTIPVRLFTAVREQRLSFRSLHDQDLQPLKQKLVCPADGKEVHREHIVKGYEISKDQYVVVRQDELDAAAPKSAKAIEIHDFVELSEIDPLYFDRPYYVAPKPEGAKPYRLLLAAMRASGKVGVSRVTMHGKEYLAALRPLDEAIHGGHGMLLETMHFGDEVVPAKSVPELASEATAKVKVDDRELKVAKQLIDTLTSAWDPTKYHDQYREAVMELIERKAAGDKVVSRPEAGGPAPSRAGNLMAALEASLKASKPHGRGAREAAVKAHPAARTAVRRRRSA